MIKCKECKFWDLNWDREEKPCNHPRIDNDFGEENNLLIKYGGFEGYGDYFHPTGEFGCILAEAR